jgi:hypothetical protein
MNRYFETGETAENREDVPSFFRRMPKWAKEIPHEASELMKEVNTALHNDSRRLAIMGARSLVDMFMNDKGWRHRRVCTTAQNVTAKGIFEYYSEGYSIGCT